MEARTKLMSVKVTRERRKCDRRRAGWPEIKLVIMKEI